MTFQGDRGFTLGEILVALFILAVALLAMARMQMRAMDAGSYSGRMSVALALAQEEIERAQISLGDVCANPPPAGYTRTCQMDAAAWPGAVKLTVTVTWPQSQRGVELKSLVVP